MILKELFLWETDLVSKGMRKYDFQELMTNELTLSFSRILLSVFSKLPLKTLQNRCNILVVIECMTDLRLLLIIVRFFHRSSLINKNKRCVETANSLLFVSTSSESCSFILSP
jgi:hypothetical protein